jgi:hypothetical protein
MTSTKFDPNMILPGVARNAYFAAASNSRLRNAVRAWP